MKSLLPLLPYVGIICLGTVNVLLGIKLLSVPDKIYTPIYLTIASSSPPSTIMFDEGDAAKMNDKCKTFRTANEKESYICSGSVCHCEKSNKSL